MTTFNQLCRIDSFRNRNNLEWPDIVDSTSFEGYINFNSSNLPHIFEFTRIIQPATWLFHTNINPTINTIHKINAPRSLTDLLNVSYNLLVETEFCKYKDKMVLLYMKINLLRDNDVIIPDIAAYMKNLM